MAKTMVSARLNEDLAAWCKGYAKARGVSVATVLEGGLRELRGLSEGGVPELDPEPPPKSEAPDSETWRDPSTGNDVTIQWREPTEAEIASVLERYPHLTNERAHRMARAEAWQADKGIPQPVPEPTREPVTPGQPREGDFAKQTAARAEVFSRLRTPESAKKWGRS